MLRPPFEVYLERAAARPDRPLADRAVLQQLWHAFADLAELERHVVATGTPTPEELADRVAEALADGTLALYQSQATDETACRTEQRWA